MTSVRKRPSELFKLEIWLNSLLQSVVPIFNPQIVVGRGSKSRPVDIALSGDPEISRRHAILGTDGAGNFWVVNEGRNPAMINNYELPSGQRVPLQPGTNLVVGNYILRIRLK
jgi:pSer/pThr/pTyr-binding forkhead associated (FHA) protein